jgi:hypothetical protein
MVESPALAGQASRPFNACGYRITCLALQDRSGNQLQAGVFE